MTEVARRAGAGDCERCRDGLISQPVNVVSSLGYVAAGVANLRDGSAREPIESVVDWSSIAAGIGSIAYHGPGGPKSMFVHDAGLISLLGSIGVADLARRAGYRCNWPTAAAVPLAATALARSRWNEPAQVIVGSVALIGEAVRLATAERSRGRGDLLIGPVTAIGAAAHVLGRTGGPLCEPDSLVQPHAAWHLITASAVWLRGRSVNRSRPSH